GATTAPTRSTSRDRDEVRGLSAAAQQPVAAASARQAWAIRAAERMVTRRRSASRGRVWTLSKFTTQSVGTPSRSAVRSSSDTSPLRVRASAATTTAPMRSATGSRVSTSTGRSPPGVAANQTSPRRIGPVRPVLRRTPVRDLQEGPLSLVEGMCRPGARVLLAGQPQEMPVERLAEELGPVDAEPVGPRLRALRVGVVDPEAEHCHTFMLLRMTGSLD